MNSISTKFENAVGFSNGIARVDVEEAAAVGAELLDRDLRGDRAERERLLAAGQRGRACTEPAKRLDDALGDEDQRADERQRQQDVEQRRGSGPARSCRASVGAAAREAADHRGQHRHADRGRDEVLHRQPGHLREVGQRRLAAVELPVGVGDERRGGVEGDVPRRRSRSPRG